MIGSQEKNFRRAAFRASASYPDLVTSYRCGILIPSTRGNLKTNMISNIPEKIKFCSFFTEEKLLTSHSLLRAIHVDQRSNFGGCERDVFITDDNLQLLAANTVWLRPQCIILLHDLRIVNNSLQFLHNTPMNVGLKFKIPLLYKKYNTNSLLSTK